MNDLVSYKMNRLHMTMIQSDSFFHEDNFLSVQNRL